MKVNILRQLQEYYYDLKDDNGVWREYPLGIVARAKTPKKNIEKLRTIISILESSDKLNECSRIYMCNRKISIKAANEILNDFRQQAAERMGKTLRPLSYTNSTVKVSEDEKLLEQCLGDGFLRNIVYDIDISDREIENRLAKLIKLFGVFDKTRTNLTLYIDDSYVNCTGLKGKEEFFEKLKTLESYLVQRKHIIENVVNEDKEFVGYFNYLLSCKGVQDKEIERDRERLLKFLNNQDYFTGYGNDSNVESYDSLIVDTIINESNDIKEETAIYEDIVLDSEDDTSVDNAEDIGVGIDNHFIEDTSIDTKDKESLGDNKDSSNDKQELIDKFAVAKTEEDYDYSDDDVII